MIGLRDFLHLPQVDGLVDAIADTPAGLILVVGHESPSYTDLLPSGRSTVYRILMHRLVERNRAGRALRIAVSPDPISLPRSLSRSVQTLPAKPGREYDEALAAIMRHGPGLLLLEQFGPANAQVVLEGASRGWRIVAPMASAFRGAGVARELVDGGATPSSLGGLAWVVTSCRLPLLCSTCKQPYTALPGDLTRISQLAPTLDASALTKAQWLAPGRCAACNHTGHKGEVMALDFFGPSGVALSMEEYIARLAMEGHVSIQDVESYESMQLRRLQRIAGQASVTGQDARANAQRYQAELEASRRVLHQRTQALMSLERLGLELISSTDLSDLASRVCTLARDLCGIDRAVLYHRRPDEQAEIMAVVGWDAGLVHQTCEPEAVFGAEALVDTQRPVEAQPFSRWPPGVPERDPDVEGARLRSGLQLPLVAQNKLEGLLIVHATTKSKLAPGDVALLQMLANQAALAVQRARLIDTLRAKIELLETAQAELVRKERMERELELARQVQQSLLPREFPVLAGLNFAAHSVPARQVGGDFYDVIWLDQDRCGIVIADVSDKGLPAALFMGLSRSLILAEARRESSPAQVLGNVNDLLLELGGAQMFLTAFYGVLDRRTRRLTYVRAGHERPVLTRDGAAQVLPGDGAVLGFLSRDLLNLTECETDLRPGDRLVLFTDGLVDTFSPEGHALGRERLLALLAECATVPLGDFCASVFEKLTRYRGEGEQFDDMAMLTVDVHEAGL